MNGEIVCSKCDEVIEVTADSVTLPFVCETCVEAQEFLNKIAPKPEPQHLPQEHAHYDGDPGDEHDGATVENTTLLIADLEQQVSALQESNAQSDRLIADLKVQLEGAEDRLDAAQAVIITQAREKARLAYANEELQQNMDTLFGRIESLRLVLSATRTQLKHYKQRMIDLFDEVMFYRHQGFFGRLRGKAYTG